MKSLKEVSLSFLSAIASSIVILGAILVAMTEGITLSIPTIEPTSQVPVVEDTLPPGVTAPARSATPTHARPVIVTITPTPLCTKTPSSWEWYKLLPGDSLRGLADMRGISLQNLIELNCLASENVKSGMRIR